MSYEKDPRVDAYIDALPEWQQAICRRVRDLVHEAARWARDSAVAWIELKTFAPNRGAMTFWEELGFTPRVVQLTSATRDLLDRMDGG